MDGLLDIQNFIRVTEIQKGKSLGARMGLTVTSMIISAVGSLMDKQHLTGKLLTMPDNVMQLVEAGYNYERQNYTLTGGLKM